ncbi:MAG: hypothetical protein AAF999_06050 [Pseudomonadota bacterium]
MHVSGKLKDTVEHVQTFEMTDDRRERLTRACGWAAQAARLVALHGGLSKKVSEPRARSA